MGSSDPTLTCRPRADTARAGGHLTTTIFDDERTRTTRTTRTNARVFRSDFPLKAAGSSPGGHIGVADRRGVGVEHPLDLRRRAPALDLPRSTSPRPRLRVRVPGASSHSDRESVAAEPPTVWLLPPPPPPPDRRHRGAAAAATAFATATCQLVLSTGVRELRSF